ncbi:MAG: hypothetical protein IH934_04665 [Nanoarchaeota archaeon]|nr:hypothetical protein [Nanoarchaeota archaeon]
MKNGIEQIKENIAEILYLKKTKYKNLPFPYGSLLKEYKKLLENYS